MSSDDPRDENETGDAPAGDLMSYPSVEEMDALLPDFRITKIIGQGGMGVVYRAWQERLERYVAIKVLPKVDDADVDFAKQFKREAKTMAALHHSHIATVYDFGVVEGLHYLVMEHVDGETLFQHFHDGSYSPSEIISIILQVCDGLSYAHSSNVNHRDIKSANILIGQDGMSKLVDFGLATLQEAPGVLRKRSTAGTAFGTPGYSAPELFTIGSHVDHRADIYSMGVVLYEGLTGKTMDAPWTSPSAASGALAGVDQVIRKATKKDPKARYQSIYLFASALRNLRDTGPATSGGRKVAVAMPPASGATRSRVVVARKQSWGPMVAVLAVITVIAVMAAKVLTGGDGGMGSDVRSREEILSTAGGEKPQPTLPLVPPIEVIPPVGTISDGGARPDIDAPPVAMELPINVVEAEQALAGEMAEFDELFNEAYGKLTEKYLVALDRLRAGAPADGLAAIDADAASVKNGDPPPELDAQDLYPPLAKLRPLLRTEHGKLVLPIAKARIEVMEPHIQKLIAIRAGLSDKPVRALVDSLIKGHQARLAELKSALESPGTSRGTAKGAAGSDAEVGVVYKFMQHGDKSTVTIAPRGTGIGIFAGLLGEISSADATVFVPPASLDGNWEISRAGSSGFLHGRALYYDNPHFDFSKASFDTYEWTSKSPNKRLIDADQGFAMISGVAGRIGSGTNFAISHDEKIDHWYCDGKASNKSTKVIVTQVKMPGGLWLKVTRNEFQWRVGQPRLKMIHKDDGFCVLTGIRGPFNGGGENVKLWIDDRDGFWYVGGASGVGGVAAKVTAFVFPKD